MTAPGIVVAMALAMCVGPPLAETRGAPGAPRPGAAPGDDVSCGWQPGFGFDGIDGPVHAMTVFDDGGGPALYVGGEFWNAAGSGARAVAKWDGHSWAAVAGSGESGISGDVFALAVYDDGTGAALYAAGSFRYADGIEVNNIARWDGAGWSPLGHQPAVGIGAYVRALAVHDDGSGPALYVGGTFSSAGGISARGIARWDGTGWSAVVDAASHGITGYVFALASFDDGSGGALFAAGQFGTIGSLTVNGIARWDGTSWSALTGSHGTGVEPEGFETGVLAFAVHDDGLGPALFAGGQFTTAGGITVNHIARWDGTEWSALQGVSETGLGNDAIVHALMPFDRGAGVELVVSGEFQHVDGVVVNHVASWDGSAWDTFGEPGSVGLGPGPSNGRALTAIDLGSGPSLVIGGEFFGAGDVLAPHLASWDGGAWSGLTTLTGNGLDGSVRAIAQYDDGSGPAVYVGGSFTMAGGTIAASIARWNGSAWSVLEGHPNAGWVPSVNALIVHDDGGGAALYVGGVFDYFGGVEANSIVKWDGTDWSALTGPSGNGVQGFTWGRVNSLAVHDRGAGPELYAGGFFERAGGVTASNIARWDGQAWHALTGPSGEGTLDEVLSIASFDDGSGPALYVGGRFPEAGGVGTAGVAKWTGSEWVQLMDPMLASEFPWIGSFAVYDDGSGPSLVAGGHFEYGLTTGPGVVANIARWDSGGWSGFGDLSGWSTSINGYVAALNVLERGDESLLVAGGSFTEAGGVPALNLAAWDGGAWMPLTDPPMLGPDASVWALSVADGADRRELVAGGVFSVVNGTQSRAIAFYQLDNVVPADPTSVVSTSHVVGEWSALDSLSVEWSGASDTGCSGLEGYSLVIDTAATTLPDALVDVPHTMDPHGFTSAPLGDAADHYVHLRACDGAGSCSTGVHLGPFGVDTTAPTPPGDVVSTSHTPGISSCSRSIDLVWSPANDQASGLDGYAWAATAASSWECDGVRDLDADAVSLTTPPLADGGWFYHLSATDAAGNWSPVVSTGPFLICPLFADNFESGGTGLWSQVTAGGSGRTAGPANHVPR